jgi:putative chitinase
MNFTVEQLTAIIGRNPYVEYWHHAICAICPEYNIDSPVRLAAFIAQCAHESAKFTHLRENLNYRAATLMKTWPKRFKTLAQANEYAHNPQKIANYVYSNRMGNGDESSGDGWKFIGRGLIQLTGKENYMWFAKSISTPVEEIPEYLETFEGAVQGACFFWETNDLNLLADKKDVVGLTKKINGGQLGIEERKKLFKLACTVLGA